MKIFWADAYKLRFIYSFIKITFIYVFFFLNNQLKNYPYGIKDTFKLPQAGKFMFLAIFMYLFPSFISHKNVMIISREISIMRFLYLYYKSL